MPVGCHPRYLLSPAKGEVAIKKQVWSYILLIAGSSGIMLLISHALWLPLLGAALVVADPLQPADAIVPLAGGYDRARYAASLVRAGYAPRFVVTDVRPAMGQASQLFSPEIAGEALDHGVFWHQLRLINTPVASTYQEALAVRELAQAQRWQSLIVVTSPAHTRRARAVFRSVFAGSDIRIVVRPIVSAEPEATAWWHDEDRRQLVLTEYLKFFAFRLGYHR